MLYEHQRIQERLERMNIPGGLPPSATLLNDLIRFLNGTRTTRGRRVVTILECMLEIEAMARGVEGVILPDISFRKTDPSRFELLCVIDHKMVELQKELEYYRFLPRAEV